MSQTTPPNNGPPDLETSFISAHGADPRTLGVLAPFRGQLATSEKRRDEDVLIDPMQSSPASIRRSLTPEPLSPDASSASYGGGSASPIRIPTPPQPILPAEHLEMLALTQVAAQMPTAPRINRAPIDLLYDATGTLTENSPTGTVIGTFMGVDPDSPGRLTYLLADNAGGRFTINPTTGVLRVANGSLLNASTHPSHTVRVSVFDPNGNFYEEDFTLTVGNINEAPTNLTLAGSLAIANPGFEANPLPTDEQWSTTPPGWTVLGTWAGDFNPGPGSMIQQATEGTNVGWVDAMGAGLTQTLPHTLEANTQYQLLLDVGDRSNAILASHTIRLTAGGTILAELHNVEPPPGGWRTVALAFDSATLPVGSPVLGQSLQIELLGTGSGGQVLFDNIQLLKGNITVDENAANGTQITTFVGSDADLGDTLTYSLTDNAGGRFAINAATGVLSVANSSLLNFETDRVHQVTVRVTDSGGLSLTTTQRIVVNNLNEAPASLDVLQSIPITNHSFEATALADNMWGSAPPGWTVQGATAGDFNPDVGAMPNQPTDGQNVAWVSSNASLTQDLGELLAANTEYRLSVQVGRRVGWGQTGNAVRLYAGNTLLAELTDQIPADGSWMTVTLNFNSATLPGGSPAFGQPLRIELANTGIGQVLFDDVRLWKNLSTLSIQENLANTTSIATFIGTDPDLGNTLTYTLVDDAGGRFAINTTTGVLTVANGQLLNFEAATSHGITVRVTDNHGLSQDFVRTVTVTDVIGETLVGTGGNDVLQGNLGSDHFTGGAGADTLIGGAATDFLAGGTGIDTLLGGAGNDYYFIDDPNDVVVEQAGEGIDEVQIHNGVSFTLPDHVEILNDWSSGNNSLVGNSLDNLIIGFLGNNTLVGLAGNDTLDGNVGADTMSGGLGDDLYQVDNTGDVVSEAAGEGTDTIQSSISFTLATNVEVLSLTGSANINATGSAVNDTLVGNTGDNLLEGGEGNDIVYGGAGNDTLDTGLYGFGETAATWNILYGEAGNDVLWGASNIAVSDTLVGGTGDDTLRGVQGDDTYIVAGVGDGIDVIDEYAGNGNDTLRIGAGGGLTQNQIALYRDGNHLLIGYVGSNDLVTLHNHFDPSNAYRVETIRFDGTGNTLIHEQVGAVWNAMVEYAALNSIPLTNLNDVKNSPALMAFINAAWSPTPTPGNDILFGTSGNNTFDALAGNDTVLGLSGDDTLIGNAGEDTLDGGAGADSLAGGTGNDWFVVDNTGDVVTEAPGEGNDMVFSSVSFTLTANVETLSLIGTANLNAWGTWGARDTLYGNSGHNTIQGLGGGDLIYGGAGNDELWARTNDWNYDFNAATLYGEAGNDNLIGSNSDDTLDGGSGTDYAWGAGGNDLILGGDNDDAFLMGGSGNDTLRGEAGSDILYGYREEVHRGSDFSGFTGDGHDTLDGGTGTDTMYGAGGNDVYFVDDSGDVVVESANEGADTIQSSISYTLSAHVETLILTGITPISATGTAAGGETLIGNVSHNTLDGGAGADTLMGGDGVDVYIVDNAGDVVVENAGEGNDRIYASITYTLSANVETLSLTGSANLNAYGNTAGGTLQGNTGNNTLQGYAGNDVLEGGAGDDRLMGHVGTNWIDNGPIMGWLMNPAIADGNDILYGGDGNDYMETGNGLNTVYGGEGNDRVWAGMDADVLYGEAGNDTLIGLYGNDTVDGGAGDDWLYGHNTLGWRYDSTLGDYMDAAMLDGNDTLYGRDGNDYIETGNGLNTVYGGTGKDRVWGGNDVDTLYGESGNDILFGLGGDNYLDGSTDNDFIITGGGNNTAMGGDGNDILLAATDNDLFWGTNVYTAWRDDVSLSPADWTSWTFNTLIGAGNNTLLGGAGDDVILGNSGNDSLLGEDGDDYLRAGLGNDVLDGGAGIDTMVGNGGDDLYWVDNAGDVVTEGASEGTDTVRASVSYTLAANVEILSLTGSANINAVGGAGVNTLVGNTGNNTLDGGTGADTMIGGLGDDTYVVDNADDVILENGGEGTDTLYSSIFYTLPPHIEVLIYTGSTNLNAQGTSGNNELRGNTGANSLDGGDGDDILYGDNTFQNANLVVDGEFNGSNVWWDQLWEGWHRPTFALSGWTITAGNLNYASGTARVSNFQAMSGDFIDMTGNQPLTFHQDLATTAGQTYTVSFSYINQGGGTLRAFWEGTEITAINTGQGGAWQTFTATVAATTNGSRLQFQQSGGGDPSFFIDSVRVMADGLPVNTLAGGAGNDTLYSGLAVDTLIGGTGNDTYHINNLNDVITENANEGTDTVVSLLSYTLGANLENLTLGNSADATQGVGNAGDNVLRADNNNRIYLYGLAGNDTLYGNSNTSYLVGGTGNDTYYVYTGNWSVIEAANEGYDTLVVSNPGYYYLQDHIEAVLLTETTLFGSYEFAGNNSSNLITGNSHVNTLSGSQGDDTLLGMGGDDTLDGGEGADTLTGGTGNDFYTVDNTGDTLNEAFNEGTDVVSTTISFTLGANLETLILGGTSNINGEGNSLVNTLTGNSGNNTLSGRAGADVYIINGPNQGQDVLQDNGDTTGSVEDVLEIRVMDGLMRNHIAFFRQGDDLQIGFQYGTGSVTLRNYFLAGSPDQIERIVFTGDNTSLTLPQINALLGFLQTAATNLGLPLTSLSDVLNSPDLMSVMNAAWNGFTMTLGDTTNNTLTGTTGDDTLVGLSGNDSLVGDTGNDALYGGAGVDTLEGGDGNDTLMGADSPSANLVLNGSFENGSTGWTTSGNQGVISSQGRSEGSNAMSFNSGNSTPNGVVSQTIATQIGETYTLQFDYTAFADAQQQTIRAEVISGGTTLHNQTYSDIGDWNVWQPSGWTTITVSFVATSTSTTIRFTDVSVATNSVDLMLDNVRLYQTLTDTLIGGTGDDTYYVTGNTVIVENPGEGIDTVHAQGMGYSLGANLENLVLSNATSSSQTFYGNDANNVIRLGASGNYYTVMGGQGNDTYYGSDGDGSEGAEVYAGNGNNVFHYGNSASLYYEYYGGSGVDIVYTGSNTLNDENFYFRLGDGNDIVYGLGAEFYGETGGGNDTFYGSNTIYEEELDGDGGNDTFYGGNGYNYFGGGDDNDLLYGGGGDDELYGDEANDILYGGSDDDYLEGEEGSDTLYGEAGNDTYALESNAFNETTGYNDVIEDNGTINDVDVLSIESHPSNSRNSLVLLQQGNDLQIGFTSGNGTTVTLRNQFAADGLDRIEQIQFYESGTYVLSHTAINTLVANMASYATANSLSLSSLADVSNNAALMSMINNAWVASP